MKKVLLAIAFVLGMGSISHAQAIVPQIVYSNSVIAQTGTDDLGTVYTTPSEGMYRLNGVSAFSSGTCSVTIYMDWTGTGLNPIDQQKPNNYLIPSGTAISLKYSVNGGSCSTTSYDAFVTIEKIG